MDATEMVDLISRLGSDTNVPTRVKQLRDTWGWSLQELSDRLAEPPIGYQINKSSLWKIESGTPPRQVSFREATAFARVFNVPLEDLYLTDGQLAQRELSTAVNRALQALADAHAAWVAYGNAVQYAQAVLERVEDRETATSDMKRARDQLQRKEQRNTLTLWRRYAAKRTERGEQVRELVWEDEAVLASEDFARFARLLSEQPTHPAIDDILAGDGLNANALLPGRERVERSA